MSLQEKEASCLGAGWVESIGLRLGGASALACLLLSCKLYFWFFGIFQMRQVVFLPRLLYLQLKLNPYCPWGQTKQLDITSPGVAISDREAASLLLKIKWT